MWQLRDELWEVVEPLVPAHKPDPRGGRPRVDDRACFGAIVFVLFTGIAWRHVPRELGCWAATAHRRVEEWEGGGVFAALHGELLRRLNAAGAIDWSAAVVDGSHIRALQGGLTGPSPVDRARTGSKHDLLTDATGRPWPSASPAATATTSPSCCRSSTASARFVARSGDHGGAPSASSPTAAMTTTSTAANCAGAASRPSSRGAAPSTAPASAASAGSSSELSPGCTTCA